MSVLQQSFIPGSCKYCADMFPFYDSDTCNIKPTAPLPVNCGEKSITLPVNKGFTKKQTLFLIHLMGIHLAVEGEGPAKTFDDLNRRMRLAKKTKKLLWEEMAAKLSTQFGEDFHPDKVARKWLTLVQGYKKVKDHNASTGRGPGQIGRASCRERV